MGGVCEVGGNCGFSRCASFVLFVGIFFFGFYLLAISKGHCNISIHLGLSLEYLTGPGLRTSDVEVSRPTACSEIGEK